MVMNDTLAHALSAINNASNRGKQEIEIYPSSKVINTIMELLKVEGYIENFETKSTTRGKITTVKLNGKINKIGVIKPRFSIKIDSYEKFEKRYLPAKDFGRIFVSTTKGIMTHISSKKENNGGKLLAYVY
jgi:small subunit ribosomal protein S8